MKNYIFAIVFVCLATSGYGAKPEQIPLQQNKVCQIIFPDKIAKIRGDSIPITLHSTSMTIFFISNA